METALRVLSDNEIEQLHDRSLSLLATMGARVDSERARNILKKAGADVDRSANIVRYPRRFVEECLRLAPRDFTLGGRRPGWNFKINDNKCTLLPDGEAMHVIDGSTRERRPATFDDWAKATQLIDALDEVGVYWAMVETTSFIKSPGDFVR